MKTAQQHLADYKVSMADALAFVTSNLSSPKTIFDTCKAFGVTNAMLAEIIQPSFAGATSADVQAFFNANGFKASLLDSVTFEGHEYLFVNQAMTWANAQAHAISLGGSLAVVNSQAENDFVFQQSLNQFVEFMAPYINPNTVAGKMNDGGGAPYVWLGASDIAKEGTWQWVDGSSLSMGNVTDNTSQSGFANWGFNHAKDISDWIRQYAYVSPVPGITYFSEPDGGTFQNVLGMGLTDWVNPLIANATNYGLAGQWNDINQNNLMPFVVEIA